MWALENNLRSFVSAGDFARGYLRFARFSTLMSAKAINGRQ